MSSIFFETPLRMQRQRWILGCIRDNIHDTVSSKKMGKSRGETMLKLLRSGS
jgi:hypothetical protein